eukprot:jgi/Botrbrau1/1341/Bobra.0063s0052.1
MGASGDRISSDNADDTSTRPAENSIFQLYDSSRCVPISAEKSFVGHYAGVALSTAATDSPKAAHLHFLQQPAVIPSPRSSLERSSTSVISFSPTPLLEDPPQQCASASVDPPSTPADGPWKDIPDDILKRVLDCMPASYIRVVRRVCRGWCDSAARYITRLKPESFDARKLAGRFPYLQALHLSHCNMAMVAESQSALQFRSLLSDNDLEQLPELCGMRSLRVMSLQRCTALTGNPEGPFRHLASLTQLTALDIGQCESLQEAAMEVIIKLPNLAALYMTGCRSMTDAAIARLVEARPDLRELEFGASALITDAGLAHLAQLRDLERLSMTRCPSISDEGLMHLLGLPRLRTVIISCCANISEEGVRTVAAHQTLKVVTAAVLPTRRISAWQASAYPTLDMQLLEFV